MDHTTHISQLGGSAESPLSYSDMHLFPIENESDCGKKRKANDDFSCYDEELHNCEHETRKLQRLLPTNQVNESASSPETIPHLTDFPDPPRSDAPLFSHSNTTGQTLTVGTSMFLAPATVAIIKKKKKMSKKQIERNRVLAQSIEQRQTNAIKKRVNLRISRKVALEQEKDEERSQTFHSYSAPEDLAAQAQNECYVDFVVGDPSLFTQDDIPIIAPITHEILPNPVADSDCVRSWRKDNIQLRRKNANVKSGKRVPRKTRGQNNKQRLRVSAVNNENSLDAIVSENNISEEIVLGKQSDPLVGNIASVHGNTVGNLSLLDTIKPPLADKLSDFERNADAALLLFHENGGLYRFTSTISNHEQESSHNNDEIPGRLWNLCDELDKGISNDVKNSCIERFQSHLDYVSPLLACGACGVRSFTHQPHANYDLKDPLLRLLMLDSSAVEQHENLGRYKALSSVFILPDTNHRFYLHPELVVSSSVNEHAVFLCQSCVHSLQADCIPKFAIANGHDYGRMERLPELKQLTIVETYLIALVRLYITHFKLLASANNQQSESGFQCLKGHIICFPHDGPLAASARLKAPDSLPCAEDILNLVTVIFVGTDDQYDRYLKDNFPCAELRIRKQVVYDWLAALKAVNPLYASVVIDDSPAARQRLDDLDKQIREKTRKINDPETINLEKVIGSDPAGVRWHVSDVDEEQDAAEHSSNEPVLSSVLVTDSNGVEWLPPNENDNHTPNDVFKQLDGLVNSITAKNTSDVPINEFTDNDRLFLGAFPHLFLFGRGFPAKASSSADLHFHYLHQFTGVMAKSSHFLFALSNQLRRHAAVRSVSTRVKNTPDAFEKFSRIVNSEEFKKRARKAVDDPLGPDAKYVIRVTEPYIRMCGKNVPYSPMERADAMGNLCAMTQRFGTPSIFLTISPDDTHHPLTLRAAFPSNSNSGFPAEPGDFLGALHRGDLEYQQHSICENSIRRLVSDNPVVSTAIFKKIMETLFDVLLGIPVVYKAKKTTPLSTRSEGVFGPVTAAFSVTETQGRGSLHAHLAVWGTKVTPELLQKASPHPSLVQRIGKILDTMLIAMIPKEKHLESMMDRIDKVKRPKLIYEQSPRTTMTNDNGMTITNPAYYERVYDIMNHVQIHSHRQTCLKGAHGKIGCRLSKPSGLTTATACVQLEKVNGTVVPRESIEQPLHLPAEVRDFSIHPLPPVDNRCIIWELERPTIKEPPSNTDQAENQDDWPQHLLIRFSRLPTADQDKIRRAMIQRNGSIVEVNDVISSLLASNTAAYLLGGAGQAKSILFYLLKYMTKDSVALTNSIVVINDTLKHIRQYPSIAENSGTDERTAAHFLQRVINSLSGKIELSATQAAAHLLNMPSALSSTGNIYCFVRPAAAAISRRLGASQQARVCDDDNSDMEADYEENGETASEDDDDDLTYDNIPTLNEYEKNDSSQSTSESCTNTASLNDGNEETTVLPRSCAYPPSESRYGSVPIYKVNGVPTPVAQDTHYAYRGSALERLSLYEYTGIISVIKKPTSESASNLSARGRKKNATFDFDPRHCLSATHTQRLRSLQETPILAGGPPPKYPGSKPEYYSASWTRQADQFARYFMTAFCPWDLENLIPKFGVDWRAFGNYMSHLHGEGGKRETTFLERSRAKLIESASRSLTVNKKNKDLMVLWRGRNATPWNGKSDFSGDFQKINASDRAQIIDREVIDKRAEEIEILRRATLVDEATLFRQQRQDKAMADFISNTLTSLDSIFEGNFQTSSANESANFLLTHVQPILANRHSLEDIRDALRKKVDEPQEPPPDSSSSDYPHHTPKASNVQETTSDTHNNEQRQFLRRVELYLQALASGIDPPQELLLLYGGPGVGKTHTIIALQKLAEKYRDGVVSCAPTGSAASNIPNTTTIHHLFGMRVYPQEIITDKMLPPMSHVKLAAARLLFANKHIFLIDEISMLGPIGLGLIDQRLKEITGCTDRPFGGLLVILSGDPYQLQPIKSKALFSAAVDMKELTKNSSTPVITPSTIGAELFTRFVKFELSQQMRTDDPDHINLINKLRNPLSCNPIDDSVIHSLMAKQLLPDDVRRDSTWATAPIVVTLNEVRANLNYNMATRFAKVKKVPIIRWKLPISGERANFMNPEEIEQLYNQERGLWGVFVAGAPGFLTVNINPSKGLANGTPIIYESLSFDHENDIENVRLDMLLISLAEPGELITLDAIPKTINVTVPSIQPNQWPENQTLIPGRVVIPVFQNPSENSLKVRPCGRLLLPGEINIVNHAVELGFAITYEKVQGKTMSKIILDLNTAPTRPLRFSAVYTGVTRVRKGADLKILPIPPGKDLRHLKKLSPDAKLLYWLRGFDKQTGRWSRSTADKLQVELSTTSHSSQKKS